MRTVLLLLLVVAASGCSQLQGELTGGEGGSSGVSSADGFQETLPTNGDDTDTDTDEEEGGVDAPEEGPHDVTPMDP